MKLSDFFVAALAFFVVFANAALAADIKYKANLPITGTQRSAVVEALNVGLNAASQ